MEQSILPFFGCAPSQAHEGRCQVGSRIYESEPGLRDINLGVVSHGNGYDQLENGERKDNRTKATPGDWSSQKVGIGKETQPWGERRGSQRGKKGRQGIVKPSEGGAVLWESGGQLGVATVPLTAKRPDLIRTDRASLNLATLKPPRAATRVTFGVKVGWDKEMHGGKAGNTYEDNSLEKCV